MRCPQCGHEAVGMARACPSCGYMLPFSLRQHRQLRDNPPETTRLQRADGNVPDGAARPGAPSAPFSPSAPAGPSTPGQFTPTDGSWPATSQPVNSWPATSQPVNNSWPAASPPVSGTPSDSQLPDWLQSAAPQPDGNIYGPPAVPSPNSWAPLGGSRGGRWLRTGAPDPTADPDERFAMSNGAGFATSGLMPGAARPAPLEAGTLLRSSRYRLMQPYGAAPMAGQQSETDPPLFLASDAERPGQRVLVQELPTADLEPGLGDQVQRRVVSRLELFAQHPALPQLMDVFVEHGRRFLVFAMPDGVAFPGWREAAGTLTEAVVVRIAIQVLDALMRVEGAMPPIVHGNIAPANIIIGADGMAVLIGFSAALLAQGAGSGQSGDAGGALGYAAPEQLSGRADARTDVFALAAVLHWAITGREPREAIGGAVEPARHINHAVTAAFDGLLARALQPDPTRRFQSAGEMRRAIAMLLEPGLDLGGGAEGDSAGQGKKPGKPPKAPKGQKRQKEQKAPKTGEKAMPAQMMIGQTEVAQRAVSAAQMAQPAPAPQAHAAQGKGSAGARRRAKTKTRTVLPGAAGVLRAAYSKRPPRRGGKVRRPRPVWRFFLSLFIIVGGVGDLYFYLLKIHSPLLNLLRLLPHLPILHH